MVNIAISQKQLFNTCIEELEKELEEETELTRRYNIMFAIVSLRELQE